MKIPFVKPSTQAFIDEARKTPGYSLLDFIHGYVYFAFVQPLTENIPENSAESSIENIIENIPKIKDQLPVIISTGLL